MKTKSICVLALMLLCLPLTTRSQELRGKIERSIKDLKEEFSQIPENKVLLLDQLASRMAANMDKKSFTVIFVDQANDEMGQLAMIWLRTGLIYYNLNDNFNIESAGIETSNEPLNLSALADHGFKIKNDENNEFIIQTIKYGSGHWEINRKNLNALNLNEDNSIKVYVKEGLTERNAEILFDDREAIAAEMLYVAAQVNAIVKTKMNNP